jgi:hypothetical protein
LPCTGRRYLGPHAYFANLPERYLPLLGTIHGSSRKTVKHYGQHEAGICIQ